MARLDTEQIDRNRRIVADSAMETPWNPAIEDCDADYAEHLYDKLPQDRVGHLPPAVREED